MPISHLFLALLVILIWGCNFIFIKFALNEISPLLLCTARFFLACFPAIFFIKPPAVPFRLIVLWGFVTFGMQFAFVFMGIKAGMTPGLAALLIQTQVFFSIFFAMLLLKEIPTFWQIAGALVSFCGIGIVALHFDQTASFSGFLLIIAGAASWGFGNLITKKMGQVNMIALVVWGSLVACIPFLLLTLFFEGSHSIISSLNHLSGLGLASILYIVYGSTWIGYAAWNWLISRYTITSIVPLTLLVPVIAMLSSAIVFNEPFQTWKLCAGLLVLGGLFINLFGAKFFNKKLLRTDGNS